MPPDRGSLPDHSACGDWLSRLADYLSREDRFRFDATIPDGASTVDGLRVAADEVDRLRAEIKALKANTCPDAEVCKTCPCASEDDACFPGERLRAEVEALGALINTWALDAINGADRLQLANAMLDQGAVGRFIERANGEDDEVAELRAGISWARGLCTDEKPHAQIDHFLGCVLAGRAQLPLTSDDNGACRDCTAKSSGEYTPCTFCGAEIIAAYNAAQEADRG